jgi:hypothetical protein
MAQIYFMTMNFPKKNPNLLNKMELLNTLLYEVEKSLYKSPQAMELPLVLVVGCPRSGTTLITQWLAASGAFAYPTNFISRFFKAPILAYLIQDLITNPEYQFGDEFVDIKKSIDFKSDLGKTNGFLAPHGFWFFWRQFFQFPEIPNRGYDFDRHADYKGFSQAISSWQTLSQKPVFLKATIANYYIAKICAKVEKTYVIYVNRDIHSTTYSLLKSRERYNGNRDIWYSYKTPDYESLLSLPAEQQVTQQYLSINSEITKQLESIDDTRKIHIEYSKFCTARGEYEEEVRHKIAKDVTFPELDIRYSACEDNEHISLVDQYLNTQW